MKPVRDIHVLAMANKKQAIGRILECPICDVVFMKTDVDHCVCSHCKNIYNQQLGEYPVKRKRRKLKEFDPTTYYKA